MISLGSKYNIALAIIMISSTVFKILLSNYGMDNGVNDGNGTIHLVPIANPTPPGIVVSSANVKSEPQNSQPNQVHVQMPPGVQYIQEPSQVAVSIHTVYTKGASIC